MDILVIMMQPPIDPHLPRKPWLPDPWFRGLSIVLDSSLHAIMSYYHKHINIMTQRHWRKTPGIGPIVSSRARVNVCRIVPTKRLTLSALLTHYLEKRRTSSLYTTESTPRVTAAPFQCGTMAIDVEAAIIHGTEAPEKAWPWVVYFRGQLGHCGGTLISDRWVLTAAHCLPGVTEIAFGKRNKQVWTQYEQHRLAIQEIIYPDVAAHDVGLILLDRPVEFSDYVRPACLPNTSVSVYDTCYASGFGVTDPLVFRVSQTLQQLKVRIMEQDACVRVWLTVQFWLANSSICLDKDPNNPGAGFCVGDSGSPLSCKFGNQYHAIGVASILEQNCSKIQLPDVYVRTSPYAQWITDTIQSTQGGRLTCDTQCDNWVTPG